MRPFRACDADERFVKYPVMVMPKIDGVRALNKNGKFIGRSGKSFKNKFNSQFYSGLDFTGFDGEAVTADYTGDNLCNSTTSALTTINGVVPVKWCLFDYIVPGVNDTATYYDRYYQLRTKVRELMLTPELKARLSVVGYVMVSCWDDVMIAHKSHIDQGFEGTILRDPNGKYKYGTCTPREANYLRIKTFIDSEMVVRGIIEGQENRNVKETSPFGYAERSTHKENMVPNGMIGSIQGVAHANVNFSGKIIIKKGDEIEISAGKMAHKDRRYFFENPRKIIGQLVKYKFFPSGIKDKPRFPTFQSFRDPVDL